MENETTAWCNTCGKDTEEPNIDCPSCAQWWMDNPPELLETGESDASSL